MATSTTFVGANTRSLAAFLNEKDSDIDFVKNPNTGKIFATLTNCPVFDEDGKQKVRVINGVEYPVYESVAISENAQTKIDMDGVGTIADYQVCDMPSKDPATGMPDGKCFFLITRVGSDNVIGSLTR